MGHTPPQRRDHARRRQGYSKRRKASKRAERVTYSDLVIIFGKPKFSRRRTDGASGRERFLEKKSFPLPQFSP
jgi:hypothetical protein